MRLRRHDAPRLGAGPGLGRGELSFTRPFLVGLGRGTFDFGRPFPVDIERAAVIADWLRYSG
jgi:hypothetical protein